MKNKQITSLKGLLILMIMFYHYTYRFQTLYNINSINFPSLDVWGVIGVAGFFIISGYFIFPKNINEYNPKKFLLKRILRLYPVYFLGITLTFISVKLFRITRKRNKFYRIYIEFIND